MADEQVRKQYGIRKRRKRGIRGAPNRLGRFQLAFGEGLGGYSKLPLGLEG